MVENSPAAGVLLLDELEILGIVDNETDTLSSVDAGVPQIPEVIHAAARLPTSRSFEGHDCTEAFDRLCSACHGLSVLITGRREDEERVLLFDAGPYPDLWLENARRLGVDLSKIETISCRTGISTIAGRFRKSSRRSAKPGPRPVWLRLSSTSTRTGRISEACWLRPARCS